MLAAGIAAAAPATAQDSPAYLQYRQASAEAFERTSRPPVAIHGTVTTGTLLQADILVQPWTTDNFIAFTMAAPPGDVTSATLYVEELYNDDTAAPAMNNPATTATLNFQRELSVTARHLAWVRGTRLLKLQIPSIVPGTFGKRLKTARLSIAYKDPDSLAQIPEDSLTTASASAPFHEMLASLVANPDDITRFAVPLSEAPAIDQSPVPLGGHPDAIARFTTTAEGFVQFTGADLAAAGVNLVATPLTSVTVWTNGNQQPVHSSGLGEDPQRTVRPDDTFTLYARDSDSTYTAIRTHWIRLTAPAAEHPLQAMMDFSIHPPVELSSTPPHTHFTSTHTVEQDNPPVLTKNDQFLTILGYRWVWFTWTPSGNGSAVPYPRDYKSSGSITFDLEGLYTPSHTGEIQIPSDTSTTSPLAPRIHALANSPTGESSPAYIPSAELRTPSHANNELAETPQTPTTVHSTTTQPLPASAGSLFAPAFRRGEENLPDSPSRLQPGFQTASAINQPQAQPKPRDSQTTSPTSQASLHLSFYAHQWPPAAKPIPFNATLNGQPIGRIIVSEPDSLEHTLTAPTSLLRPMGNSLVLTPQTTNASTANLPELAFDRLTISYPRTYTMTSTTLEFHPPTPDGGPINFHLNPAITTSPLIADISGDTPIIIGSKGSAGSLTRPIHTKGPADRRYIAIAANSIPRAHLTPAVQTTNLRATTNTADLVIIAWPDFIRDLAPFIAAKRARGHAVSVVNVHDIYDQFGYGHLSPHAIREFIRYATLHWQGSPRGAAASTILLVGDSTSAYRNEFRNDVTNYVPTMRITDTTDPYASDQWFVSFFGDDHFADALLGRFSVNNRQDLQNLISKQLDYETKSAPGPWKNTLGFIADHSEFEDSIDRVMRHAVPPRFFMDSIRMDDLPWIDNYYFPKDIADAREAKVSPVATRRIRDMFNTGASVVTYFGHGSPNIWSNERMWFGGDSPNSDNLLLTNRDRLPIVINMTCNSGAIDYPQPRWNICISEDFMRVKNGGAIACFVPSGPGLTVQHERLMLDVGRTLFGPEKHPLGHSMQLALWRYLAAANPPELARMYIFLGDPLLIPHIASPFESDAAERATSPDWPGTIALPADITALHTGGSYQFTTYADTVQPGPVANFTTSTVALPLTAADATRGRALAISVTNAPGTTGTRSTVAPVNNLGAVKLVQWRRVDKATVTNSTATLELRLRNDAPVPVLNLHAEARNSDTRGAIQSTRFDLAPFEEKYLQLEIPTIPGLTSLELSLSDNKSNVPFKTETPVAVAGLRPDDQRQAVPPAIIDPRSVETKYRKSGDEILATITCQVYVTAAEPLSNLRIGIEGPDGIIIQPSVVTVPPISPGDGTRVSLTAALPPNAAPTATYKLRFDPSAFYPEFARFPAREIELGSSQYADPDITAVTPSDPAPTDGESIFFDVTLKNSGPTAIEGLKIESLLLSGSTTAPQETDSPANSPGLSRNLTPAAAAQNGNRDIHTTGSQKSEPLKSKVTRSNPLHNLAPGATKTVRLRWDPFHNAGDNRVMFHITNIYDVPDADVANNTKELTINVRTKANVRFLEVGVLPLTPTDQAARQIRFAARLKNDGETDAAGLLIQFHKNKPRTPENLMGEVDLDSLKAGETKTVTLTYKLKPGEEHQPFQPSCEAHYKGSRQRISVD